MAKSPDAFRTISEVADWLGVQAHVLRFWESKFSQVKPIKRAGGRRYYRPNDMLLLGGIKRLLHEDGLTIKGVQKILREEGMSHVADLSQPLDDLAQTEIEDQEPEAIARPPEPEEKGVVLSFEASREREAAAEPEPTPAEAAVEDSAEAETTESPDAPEPSQEPPAAEPPPADEPIAVRSAPEEPAEQSQTALPAFLRRPLQPAAERTEPPTDNPPPQEQPVTAESLSDPAEPAGEAELVPEENIPPAPETPAKPRPRIVDIPPFTALQDFPARPGALSAASRAPALSAQAAREIAPLVQQLSALHSRLSGKPGKTTALPDKD